MKFLFFTVENSLGGKIIQGLINSQCEISSDYLPKNWKTQNWK